MADRNLTVSELTLDEIEQAIFEGTRKGLEKVEPRLSQLEKKFKFMAPTFDRETAAEYCNKSVTWIDRMNRDKNLPKVDCGHPRYHKDDLDHLLCGGRFDDAGNKLEPKKKTG